MTTQHNSKELHCQVLCLVASVFVAFTAFPFYFPLHFRLTFSMSSTSLFLLLFAYLFSRRLINFLLIFSSSHFFLRQGVRKAADSPAPFFFLFRNFCLPFNPISFPHSGFHFCSVFSNFFTPSDAFSSS